MLRRMSKPQRQKYKIVGPATWELIRAAYLAGESAPALAERYGVGVHAIRKRITVEKWSKRAFAQALEARGVKLPEKPKADFIEEGVARAAARASAEERAEAERAAEVQHWIEQVAAEQEADVMADAFERRALAQAGAAMVQGRSKEAQTLAVLAEQMRKRAAAAPVQATAPLARQPAPVAEISPEELEQRALAKAGEALARGDAAEAKALTAVAEQMRRRVEEARAAEAAAAETTERNAAQLEHDVMEFFAKAALIASHMVHEPGTAPAAFMYMIKRWREINLGEGEVEAEKRAGIILEAQRRHLEGEWEKNLPEDVRSYMQTRWEEMRVRLERAEPQ